MDKKINCVILTVGTSLLNQYKDLDVFENKNYIEETLIRQVLIDKKFGAEINSLNKLLKEHNNEFLNIYLLASDTEMGKLCCSIIKNVIKIKYNIESVEIKIILELKNSDCRNFATKGLRNLVNEVTEIIKKYSPANVVMLPIGGYKASIALCSTIANVFGIDSYYMYEDFEDIVKIPALPIKLDYDAIVEEVDLFLKLKNSETIEMDKNIFSKIQTKNVFKSLLSYEKIDNTKYLELTPLGLLFIERIELDPNIVTLKKVTKEKSIKKDLQKNNKEKHAEAICEDKQFKNLMKNIFNLGYIEKAVCCYFNPDGKGDQIFVRKSCNYKEQRVIKLSYNNKAGMGEVELFTTARNELETEKIIHEIKNLIN